MKNTSIVVDSNAEENVMLQNAKNTGLTDEEVEIITKEEYLARVDLEYIEKPTELEILKQEKEILAQSVY
ncbi:MAG TPA: hypothetical protein GX731_06035, partial [Clostridiales bacterium]|nr:hypothetical protein [Clostridiales bacterium]